MKFAASPFWDFSLNLYGRDGVADACLRLQERHGVDVNFLFYCLWLAKTGRDVDAADIKRLQQTVADWHAVVVRHLRSLRKRLKEPIGPVDSALAQRLRAQIQKIEIDAEHIEQLTLDAQTLDVSDKSGDEAARRQSADRNLAAYFSLLKAELSPEDQSDIALILENARMNERE